MKTNAGNLKRGDFVFYQDTIWQVQKADFYSPGKGAALMKTRIKNILPILIYGFLKRAAIRMLCKHGRLPGEKDFRAGILNVLSWPNHFLVKLLIFIWGELNILQSIIPMK